MSRHEWGTVHSWAGLVFLAVLITHVALHWEWLFATIRRSFTKLKAAPTQRRNAGIATVLAILGAAGLFAWAAHSGVRELEMPRHPLRDPDAATPVPLKEVPPVVDFQRDVMPIFQTSCIGCHGPKKQRSGFRVDQRDAFFAPDDATPLIVPGHAETSRLIAIVSGKVTDMKAADDHLLPASEIAILEAWIEAGAPWPE